MSVKVEGIEELTVQLEGMGNYWKMRDALLKAGALVERSAKQKCPKDNGQLAQNIQYSVDGKGTTCTVYNPLEYAPYVEYGTGIFAEGGNGRKTPWLYEDDSGETHFTRGQHPHPYMRPALSDNRNQITQLLGEGIMND